MKRAVLFWFCFGAACGAQAVTLEELGASPERWPAEVTVTASARGVVLKNGQPNGAMLLGAGRVLALTGVGPEGVTGRLGSTVVRLPVEKTDLLARLGQPVSAAPEKPAVPAPTVPVEAVRARPIPNVPPTALQQILASRLIVRENNAVRAFDSRRLNGVKFYGLYFSASWCGPCREFTPELIKDYAAIRELYPEFEIVLVSADRSEVDMLGYMKEDGIPWPAVTFESRNLREVAKHSGSGIPCLVLVDGDGKELSHSYRRGRYVGPAAVVEDTWQILKEHRRQAAR